MNYTPEEIKDALRSGDIVPYFQPQYDAATGVMTGAEVLARWVLSENELIKPASFVPVLEASGDIAELDWFMAEQACETIKELLDLELPISVNFSRYHAEDQGFTQKLCELLDSYDIPRNLFHIEITETALFLAGDNVKKWADSLHNAGFIIALDDVGSGLSNMCEITRLPIDILKFDCSVFSDIKSTKTRIVLDALFYGANRLGLDTIAEGIENNEQLKFIETCNCNKVQGFLFDAPMPKDEFLFLAAAYRDRHSENLDELDIQTYSSVGHLILQAVHKEYPLIIIGNLTKNCYYMANYEEFTSTLCPSAGSFDSLIDHGKSTMDPDYQESFEVTFSRSNLLKEYHNGADKVSLQVKQLGDDGNYRFVEITDYFVKNPSKKDILVISFNKNL